MKKIKKISLIKNHMKIVFKMKKLKIWTNKTHKKKIFKIIKRN